MANDTGVSLQALMQQMRQMQDELQATKAALAEAKAAPARAISFKITAPKLNEKTGKMEGTSGAISIYGLGRFPITLYRSQAERLIKNVPALQAFIEANAALLAHKE